MEEMIRPSEGKTPPSLPPDVIMEILIRTDIESIPRLRWVCKEWRQLLSHSYFVNHHHQRAKKVCGFILDNTSENKHKACRTYDIHFFPHPSPPLSEPLPSLTFMSEPVKILASTPHGLLLCFGLVSECYFVCKPTTQERATIPSPQNASIRMVMSVASTCPLRFRVMRICQKKIHIKREVSESDLRCGIWMKTEAKILFNCEVFDSDSFGMWKTIEGVGPLLDDCPKRGLSSSLNYGVIVKGSFFWIDDPTSYARMKIICVDLWAEEVKTLELPKEVITDAAQLFRFRLSNLHGGLGFVCCRRTLVFDLWAMVSMVEQRWEKLQVFDLYAIGLFGGLKFEWMRDDFIVDNTVLTKHTRRMQWYNFKEDQYIEINLGVSLNVRNLCFFQSDYFLCNIDKCGYNDHCGS